MAFEIEYLELLITHKCNMHCDGCANYSNYNLKREMNFDDNKEYIRLWSKRLVPKEMRILGGEPTLKEDLVEYIWFLHSAWPNSARQLVTNGSFLHRHKDLRDALAATNTSIHLSFHSNDPKYLETVRPAIALLKTWDGVQVSYSDYRQFVRLYRGMGRTMLPYEDNDAVQSWLHCPARRCKTIAGGRLWKCPPIMGLRSVLEKFGIEDSPEWQSYLAYQGLGLDASEEELKRFLEIGPEHICKMCPKDPARYNKDVYNTNWERNSERVEWTGEAINLPAFIESIAPSAWTEPTYAEKQKKTAAKGKVASPATRKAGVDAASPS
jgi:hypothetical protein